MATSTPPNPTPSTTTPHTTDSPVAIVCVGMAGSGKTTFMQRINAHLHSKKQAPYVVNLDPAVLNVPFDSNIDIRDSVNYKEVMAQYNLGPNGGILTSLNLFSTKIDQILALLEKRTAPATATVTTPRIRHILVDTPGQIEVFVWSASGDILLNALASSFPTVIAYVIDTPRTTATSTFMSNMLYAVSILYKTKLPMILVFNKTDIADAGFAATWMGDWEAFQRALRSEEDAGTFGGAEGNDALGGGGSGYMGSLLSSMGMVLEEFYKHLSVVGVSSMTGDGIDGFFAAVETKKEEFLRDYKPELERRMAQKGRDKEERRQRDLDRLMRDMNVTEAGKGKKTRTGPPSKEEPETVSEAEDEEEDLNEFHAGRVDDDDDDDEEDEDFGGAGTQDGLQQRYMQALRGGDQDDLMEEDVSFERFMSQVNAGGRA
ncbi:hypothetical protein EJ05DRAFT_472673 [Pseudovirgaria hyperparasitica]|uniref:GPN-loop GTPase n=1 Tax=Pseudovirgaria hyperparasitica TaxID=470096 RepID=A0A6A6WJU0_9PEZI|nr:uncharacterized protein EJ05DRAFT_472673 [Pseudovirgaria hyperparasitica]KAF2761701.1 hypothetical protein EJ05DRAFT_472673 [Pseudovirgaria hyperparasitica]